MEQPPQLAGLFAGGMPKLKKRGGGVNTGGRFRYPTAQGELILYSKPGFIVHIRS